MSIQAYEWVTVHAPLVGVNGKKLTHAQRSVLAVLAHHVNESKHNGRPIVWPSSIRVSKFTGQAPRNIRNTLRELSEGGWIVDCGKAPRHDNREAQTVWELNYSFRRADPTKAPAPKVADGDTQHTGVVSTPVCSPSPTGIATIPHGDTQHPRTGVASIHKDVTQDSNGRRELKTPPSAPKGGTAAAAAAAVWDRDDTIADCDLCDDGGQLRSSNGRTYNCAHDGSFTDTITGETVTIKPTSYAFGGAIYPRDIPADQDADREPEQEPGQSALPLPTQPAGPDGFADFMSILPKALRPVTDRDRDGLLNSYRNALDGNSTAEKINEGMRRHIAALDRAGEQFAGKVTTWLNRSEWLHVDDPEGFTTLWSEWPKGKSRGTREASLNAYRNALTAGVAEQTILDQFHQDRPDGYVSTWLNRVNKEHRAARRNGSSAA